MPWGLCHNNSGKREWPVKNEVCVPGTEPSSVLKVSDVLIVSDTVTPTRLKLTEP